VIEIDGESHFTAEAVEYDKIRTNFIEGKGYRVLRFTNLEVVGNIEGVLGRVKEGLRRG
jgi:very-short-patch-repair endonuclease